MEAVWLCVIGGEFFTQPDCDFSCARKSSLRSYIQEFSTPFWEVYDRVDTDFGSCILDAGVCRGRVTPTHKRMLALLLECAETLHITLAFSQLARESHAKKNNAAPEFMQTSKSSSVSITSTQAKQ